MFPSLVSSKLRVSQPHEVSIECRVIHETAPVSFGRKISKMPMLSFYFTLLSALCLLAYHTSLINAQNQVTSSGWALRANNSCPAENGTTCGITAAPFVACCPAGSTCLKGYNDVCCPSSGLLSHVFDSQSSSAYVWLLIYHSGELTFLFPHRQLYSIARTPVRRSLVESVRQ